MHRGLYWRLWLTLPLGSDDKVVAVCRDFDRPIEVGSVNRRAMVLKSGDRRR